jgi:hypothetical protein
MRSFRIVFLAAMIALGNFSSHAADSKQAAALMATQGAVEIKPLGGEWVPGVAKTALAQGDFIKTGKDSWALIDINSAGGIATVELRQSTNMELAELPGSLTKNTLLDLYAGEVTVKARKADASGSKFEVKTPTSIVAVDGGNASFSVKVEQMAE